MKKKTSTPDQYMRQISNVLQQERVKLGISQEELAAKTGLHRTYVSLIERRSCNFSIKILVLLADALNLSPAEVMNRAEENINPKRRSKVA